MELNEYQIKAMSTCMVSSEKESRRNQYGGLVGSYFPEEVYNYEEEDDEFELNSKDLPEVTFENSPQEVELKLVNEL